MKERAITIETCSNCPLSIITNSGALYCNSSAAVLKRSRKERKIGRVLDFNPVPDWCPLSTLGETVGRFLLHNKVTLTDEIRDLLLRTE